MIDSATHNRQPGESRWAYDRSRWTVYLYVTISLDAS
jgi:hypothetical protein